MDEVRIFLCIDNSNAGSSGTNGSSAGGGGGGNSGGSGGGGSSSSFFNFTEKHDKSQKNDNKAHTQGLRM